MARETMRLREQEKACGLTTMMREAPTLDHKFFENIFLGYPITSIEITKLTKDHIMGFSALYLESLTFFHFIS